MTLQELISDANTALKSIQQHLDFLATAGPCLEDLFTDLPKGAYAFWVADSLHCITYTYNHPGFTADSNPELVELLDRIETVLSALGPVEISSQDNPASYERIFQFNVECLSVSLCAVLAPDSDACQRQVVGYEEAEIHTDVCTKTHRPIYKFVC